ncbi:MAG TPA: flagellar basal body P-ring formation chaperone FlgA [Beijerinckiaceae bacterium]|nr:flagellar basal body P-ring formation chaperone FlgA [Beijerinckiaceae bacterium]
MRRSIIAMVCALACAGAFAQTPALKPAAVIQGGVVRLGDIVEHAGALAATPLFRAPDLGKSGMISAERIIEAGREAGLETIDARGLTAVVVRRPSRLVSAQEIEQSVLEAIRRSDTSLTEATLRFDTPPPQLARDAINTAEIRTEVVTLDRRLERFEAHLVLPDQPGEPVRLSGSYDTRLSLPVPTRDIPRGETIQASDLRLEQRRRRDIPAGALTEPARLTGFVARKALRVGQPLRDGDVVRPDMVERNQLVTVLYESAGMTLSLRGKALAAGAEGAIVAVQNLQSKRTIETIVIGPGRVSARHHPAE